MIVAVILLLVFFTIGVSVLTAASAAISTANARVFDRQAYYYARSALDAIDASIQGGDLGDTMQEDLLSRFLLYGGETYTLPEITLQPEITVECDELSDFSIENASIVYSGFANAVDRDTSGNVTEVFVCLQNLTVSYRAVYDTNSYAMRVAYQYSGWASKSGDGWEWNGKWTVEKLG